MATTDSSLLDRDGILYLKVLLPIAILPQEEHAGVKIPQGNWEIRIQREYAPVRVASPSGEGWQYVAD